MEASLQGQVESKLRLETSLNGQVESKLRLEASLEGQVESKLRWEANLKGQVGSKLRLEAIWTLNVFLSPTCLAQVASKRRPRGSKWSPRDAQEAPS